MSIIDIIQKRYSVRSYLSKAVEKDKLLQVLEAGRLAPSAVNFQPLHYIVITEQEGKDKIYQCYARDWIKSAPTIVVICGDHSVSWKRKDGKDHCDIDVAIATDHMILTATDLGLGTCWVCAFDAKLCHELLNLPEHLEPIVLMPIGYPTNERNTEIKRKTLDEMVSWEKYQQQ